MSFDITLFKDRTVCVTGHRPDKLGGYGDEVWNHTSTIALEVLSKLRPAQVITGMALGWDMAIAWACAQLPIPYIAAVPFKGQESRWFKESKDMYFRLLRMASQVVVVSKPPADRSEAIEAMHARNKWMVDRSDGVIALWNGDKSGGTFNCLQYVWQKQKPVCHVWKTWDRKPTRVVHCKKKEYDVYIGRGKGGQIPDSPEEFGYFGNPIVKGEKCVECGKVHETGGATLPCYRMNLEKRLKDPVFNTAFWKLRGLRLGCWCDPNPCHGHIMAAILDGYEPYFVKEERCSGCAGTGQWVAGACINGKYENTGVCYRCEGKGRQTIQDQLRNHYYDIYHRRVI